MICSFLIKSKRLTRDVCNTVATQSGLIHDVIDTESWAQTGNTHRRAFATPALISSKQDQKFSERMLSFFFFSFFFNFFSIFLVSLLRSVFNSACRYVFVSSSLISFFLFLSACLPEVWGEESIAKNVTIFMV